MNTTQLEALLERVKAATVPSWELNIAIECALPNTSLGERSHRPSNARGKVTCNYPNGRSSTYKPRRYTYSVDDALDLVERVLTGWVVADLSQNSRHAGDPWGCTLASYFGSAPSKNRTASSGYDFGSAPLAILAALLTALIKEPTQ